MKTKWIGKAEVISVAEDLRLTPISDDRIDEILEEYDNYCKMYPEDNWQIIIEMMLYDIIKPWHEAIKAMRERKKVTHMYFTPEEWATLENGQILLEDGVRCSPAEFWRDRQAVYFDNDWSIFKEE